MKSKNANAGTAPQRAGKTPMVGHAGESVAQPAATAFSFISAQLAAIDGVFGITGPAGSGKTYAASQLAAAHNAARYSTDYRFIGDSAMRLELLERKQMRSLSDYRDSANQFNWWDWEQIQHDVASLVAGQSIVLDSPYDRGSGKYSAALSIAASEKILLEGAILGPPQLIDRLEKIFFFYTPPATRFERLLAKDRDRRSFNEIVARFLITEYSETIYYRNLFAWARHRLIFVDGLTGHPCPAPLLPEALFVPLRINA